MRRRGWVLLRPEGGEADVPEVRIEGNFLWDEADVTYEQRWSSDEVRAAARGIKRGARVAERLPDGKIAWLPEPSADARSSTRAAQVWLEPHLAERAGHSFALYTRATAEDSIIFIFTQC